MKYLVLLLLLITTACGEKKAGDNAAGYSEPHRPQVHFSPQKNWMNDPNGLVYYNGTWHLFFQYYPDSTVWGPMHWGHATSTDLVHWSEKPIALYPDSLGYIFSGSVVADIHNTSGLGKKGQIPLIAIFTYHDPKGEKEGALNFQNQGLAYSIDEGATWTKYSGNPVLKNPGIRDFRDPKISWNEKAGRWIMTLAVKDRIYFYSSPDCKQWTKESEFGDGMGSHGGVWECPDLFPMNADGKTVWVLLVSINPGGPQGGSATQYFIGDFDGKSFTTQQTDTRWVDGGTDNYAGVTWSNTGDRHLFLGWMSNWQYAQVVPTQPWRSAMTVPRDLSLEMVKGQYYLRSAPAKEMDLIGNHESVENNIASLQKTLNGPAELRFHASLARSFSITLSNNKGEKWIAGYDAATDSFYVDRKQSGRSDFEKGFASRIACKRISDKKDMDLVLVIDRASAELFADKGLTTLTSIFFPTENYTQLTVKGEPGFRMSSVLFKSYQSIWNTP